MTAPTLLPFQESIVAELKKENALLVLARGLGSRSVIASFLRPYSRGHLNPVLVINATADEESGINDELGMKMACIGHEMGSKERWGNVPSSFSSWY